MPSNEETVFLFYYNMMLYVQVDVAFLPTVVFKHTTLHLQGRHVNHLTKSSHP